MFEGLVVPCCPDCLSWGLGFEQDEDGLYICPKCGKRFKEEQEEEEDG